MVPFSAGPLLGEFRCPGVGALTMVLRCLLAVTVDLFKSYGLKRISLPAELAGDFGTAGRGEGPAVKIFVKFAYGLIHISVKKSFPKRSLKLSRTHLADENLHFDRLLASRDFHHQTLVASVE